VTRIPSIEHYLERALDKASLIAALATARSDEPSATERLAERQDAQLGEILHEFAFVGRKLIELAEREKLPAAKYALDPTVACAREGSSDDFPLVTMSLRDIFGRLIHSDRFKVDRAQVPAPDGNLTSGKAAWAFSVASDRDKHGAGTFVFIEFLLGEFLAFEEQLRRDLRHPLRIER
jgi:hypothetical protein